MPAAPYARLSSPCDQNRRPYGDALLVRDGPRRRRVVLVTLGGVGVLGLDGLGRR
jgi:hypothetical protein